MIIALGYKSGVGKDLACKLLQGHRMAFADALKRMVKEAFALDYDQLWGPLKDIVDPRYGVAPRQILQDMGEGVRQQYGVGHWPNRLFDGYGFNPNHLYVITDLRHLSEVKIVKKHGGYCVKLDRPTAAAPTGSGHVSEHALDTYDEWDAVVSNDGTQAQLLKKLYDVIEGFGK